MNEIQTFSEATLGSVRTTIINNEPYFAGRDVAGILGYKNISDALSKKVDPEDKGVAKCDTLGGVQDMTFINESGLYSLILSSKKPEAKRFKRWITSDVLPSIRKNGAYATEDTIDKIIANPEYGIKLLQSLAEERAKRQTLETVVAAKDQQLLEMKPKVSYYDVVLNCPDLIEITKIAKDYGWSGAKLNQMLHDLGVQFKTADGQWLLYQKYAGEGYTATRTHIYTDSSGMERSRIHTYWTQKGRLFIYDLLKEHSFLPEIERNDTDDWYNIKGEQHVYMQ